MIKSNAIGVTCAMTDSDVITRLHRLLGMGNIQTPKPTKGGKILYTWYLGMREDVVSLVTELKPLMSERRQQKISDMLEWNEANPKSDQRGLKTARHGSHRMYTHYGCRCAECTTFQATYRRSRRKINGK